MSEVKDRLPLLISIVISPVVDRLQEYGKEQWYVEEVLQAQSRSNGEQQRDVYFKISHAFPLFILQSIKAWGGLGTRLYMRNLYY